MRIGIVQFSSDSDPARNLDAVHGHLADLAGAVDLVVFPEATMCRFGVPLGPVAEPLDGPWARAVTAAAQTAGVAVIAGMFTPASDSTKVRNTLLITGDAATATEPAAVRSYDKIHLYDAFGFAESDTVEAGTELVRASIGGTTVAVATCYDLRFPELFVAHAAAGAQVLVIPTSWAAGPDKLDQWRTLARARALDTASWVVAVDQAVPADPAVAASGPTGIGHSLVVDPLGRVVLELGDGPEVAAVTIDVDAVATARNTLGVLANRRLGHTGSR